MPQQQHQQQQQQISMIQPKEVASAAVAPLADVGLREFLVKDGNELLRLSLPTSLPTSKDPALLGDVGRQVQEAVELVRLRLEQVGFSGKTTVWNACLKEVNTAKQLIETPGMLKGIPTTTTSTAKALVDTTLTKLNSLGDAIRKQDIDATLKLQEECSALVYDIRAMSLPRGVLPYNIPDEFKSYPQLRGRATVECEIEKTNGRLFRMEDGQKQKSIKLTMVLDGYHAPITTGNLVDLIQRKFYNGLPIMTAEELIVQTGKPTINGVDGFVDPTTRETRTIPLEIFYKNDAAPSYSYTSDDDMRATESMALPFQAYGAVGMAHDPEDPNTASSQFWFLKWNQALVAPSRNTLDGSQACMGYVTTNQQLLEQVQKGDAIVGMNVVDGLDNFVSNTNK